MKHLGKKLSALLVTAAMAATMASTAGAAVTYDGVKGSEVSFKKILITDLDTACPAISFDYSVEVPTERIPAASGKAAVEPGVGTLTGIVEPVSYSAGTTADDTSAVSGKNTYTKPITVDLTGVTFTEPGIYRYYIKETIPESTANYYDVTSSALTTSRTGYRTLDVYVEDCSTATGPAICVTGYVLYDGKITTAPNASSSTEATSNNGIASTTAVTIGSNGVATVDGTELGESTDAAGTKSDNIMNYFVSYDLTISKTVTGNQGSRDEFFSFTVTLTAPVGSVFAVNTVDSNFDINVPESSINAQHENPTSLVVGEGETQATGTFWLQNGQNVIITGIGSGTAYSVTEGFDTNSKLGYTVSATVNNTAQTLTDNGLSGTITADTAVAFNNERSGVIPTGVLLTMAPVIAVGLVVIAGVVFFAVRSAKRKAIEAAEADADSEE